MIRIGIVSLLVVMFGLLRVPIESAMSQQYRSAHFNQTNLNLGLREQIGQLGFIAALSGLRSLVADVLFIQAHVAWERTEWGRVLLLFREAICREIYRCAEAELSCNAVAVERHLDWVE